MGPDVAADVLFASGVRTLPGTVPVAFLRPAERSGSRDIQESGQGGDRSRVLLRDHQRYGRIDFDPLEKTAAISVRRSKDGSLVATTTLKVHKERAIARELGRLKAEVEGEIAEAVFESLEGLRGPSRRQRADRHAAEIVGLALPMAARYLEWLEWNPESPIAERAEKLADFESAMLKDIPPVLQETHHHLNRRDLYRAFEALLTGWGLRIP